MILLVSFHTSLSPVDAGILDPLTNADNPFPSAAATTTRNPFIYDVLGMTIPNLVTEQGSSMTKFRYSSWMTGLGVNPFVQL